MAHEPITGGRFDIPATNPIFVKMVQSFALSSRLQLPPGNFFSDPGPKAEALFVGHILHDLNVEEKKMLIAKAYDALPPSSALVTSEW
ncbi:MAG: hypothetical protein NPIRA03_28030 [Nitrospirales bacterium]|nr:MAG: hypothetical protein NPIRA03_28030 [Nitrospirales bacterium]